MPSQPKIDLKIDPAKRRSQISRRVDNSFPVFAPLVWHAGHADGESTKQERGTQTPYQNMKQDQNSFSNVGKTALERFVIATLYSSTLHCQTSQFTE